MKASESEKKKMREYYQNHKEEIKKNNMKYYEDHKEAMKLKKKENYLWNRVARIIKQRQYYKDHREEILKNMSEFAKKNRDVMNKRWKTHKKKYPEKFMARRIAYYRIKIPKNQICEVCNINKATDRDHRDYSKPLKVQFVCHQCNCKLERLPIC